MRNERITNKDAKVWDCGSKPAMTWVHFDTSSIRRDVASYVSTIRMCILILVSVFCLSSCEKADEYISYIEGLLGKGNAYKMSIRGYGAVCLNDIH